MPVPIAIRPATLDDLRAVVRVRQGQECADNGASTTTGELLAAEWTALGPHLACEVWVAESAAGRILASAQLIQGQQVALWVPPDARGNGLEAALIATSEEQARALARAAGATNIQLFAQAHNTHPEALAAFAEAGFIVTSTYEKMRCRMGAPPAVPPTIPGIAIRPVAVDSDEDAVYHADQEAFLDERGNTPRTLAQWRRRLNREAAHFDPALWQVAWDGVEVAGFALGEVVDDIGWIHHVGVRRPWRRRGLGAALMLVALGAFSGRDVPTIRLNVDAESLTNAQYLYRRVGFQVTGTYTNYHKEVPLT